MILETPVEVSLLILSNLTVSQLRCLHLVCRSWKVFLEVNEASVYRNAAFKAGFIISQDESLLHAKEYAQKALRDVAGWKDYCRRRLGIEQSWAGKAHSVIKGYHNTAEDICQLKVDEARGLAITTSPRTGLVVTDLEKDHVLWGLQRIYVPDIRLCEYDQNAGYLAFDKTDGSIDIWQHIQGASTDKDISARHPTEDQLEAAAESTRLFGPTALGHFKPVFNLPARDTDPQALRLVYPHLAIATFAYVHVWDVTNGKLVQTIDLSVQSQLHDLWVLQHVDISDRYVIASLKKGILVFSLEDGSYLKTIPLFPQEVDAPRLTIVAHDSSPPLEDDSMTKTCLVPRYLKSDDQRLLSSEIVAGRIWSNTLAVVMNMGNILIINRFDQVVNGVLPMSDAILNIQIPGSALSCPTYLDFHKGRIAVSYSSSSQAVYIISLRHGFDIPGPDVQSQLPNIVVSRTRTLKNMTPGDRHHGIQLTDGGMFFLSRCKPDLLELGDDTKEPVTPVVSNALSNLFYYLGYPAQTQVPFQNIFQWQQILGLGGAPTATPALDNPTWPYAGTIDTTGGQPAQNGDDASDAHSDHEEDANWEVDDDLEAPDSLPDLMSYSDDDSDNDDYLYWTPASHLFFIDVAPQL
ncbi:hypothetical protein BDZ94DRAFT_1248558 [Collybia nuda]|uniref:F-box domain-containing protein n=1 Tax=Collybia nuda TaxID=64659 RepID=A0A9P6CP43_9AGAR|nr:hypothetical protein BDZ94DRAFT_1248558 [Collybia nuda]